MRAVIYTINIITIVVVVVVVVVVVIIIRDCSSTLNVGLMGTFRTVIQKSTGRVLPVLRFYLFIIIHDLWMFLLD